MVVFDPAAQLVEAPKPVHKNGTLYDPILQAQTIEAQRKAHAAMELLHQPTLHQSSMDSCLEGAKEGTVGVATMEVDDTYYRQPKALIPDHPAVTIFLPSQERMMNCRGTFNNVKQSPSAQSTLMVLIFKGSIIPRNTTVLLQPGVAGQRMHRFECSRHFQAFSGPRVTDA